MTNATRTRKPKAPAQPAGFQPITVPEGAKEVLTPQNQIAFYNMFMAFNPEQRAAVVLVLNAIASKPLLDDGYRKFFRFWRAFGPSINVGNVTL